MIKFSTIIRTFNRAEMLKRAIKTAKHARMDEIVVAADPKATEEVQRVVDDTRDIVKVRCNGWGAGAAWAEANMVCSNEWIKILDDDDEMLPNARDVMVDHITKHGAESYRCLTSFANTMVYDNTDQTHSGNRCRPNFNTFSWHKRESEVYRYWFPHGQPLYHKSIIDVIGNIDPQYTKIHEDYDWVLRARGRLLWCPHPVILMHTHGNNISLTPYNQVHDSIRRTVSTELKHAARYKLVLAIPWIVRRRHTDRARAMYRVLWGSRTDATLSRIMGIAARHMGKSSTAQTRKQTD